MTSKKTDSMQNYLVPRDVAGAAVAAGGGVVLREAARAVYEAGGKEVLTEAAQSILQSGVIAASAKIVESALTGLLPQAAKELAPAVSSGMKQLAASSAAGSTAVLAAEGAKSIARAATTEVARSAGRELLKGVGKTAGVGFVVDAVFGTIEAVQGFRAGEMSKEEAFAHVGKEAATGAAATGAGVLACAALVALTGPAAPIALILVGAGSSFGAKRALRWLLG